MNFYDPIQMKEEDFLSLLQNIEENEQEIYTILMNRQTYLYQFEELLQSFQRKQVNTYSFQEIQ